MVLFLEESLSFELPEASFHLQDFHAESVFRAGLLQQFHLKRPILMAAT